MTRARPLRSAWIALVLLAVAAPSAARAQGPSAVGAETRREWRTGAALEVGGEEPGVGERVAGGHDRPLPPVADVSLVWPERLRRFHLAEGIFSGVLGAVGLATYVVPHAHDARWYEGNPLDDGIREGVVLDGHGDRELAAAMSDALLAGLIAAPIAIDAILVAWVARGSSDVALQMLMIDFQAHALAQGLTGLMKRAVRRERPVARSCRTGEARIADDPGCVDGSSNVAPESFFSGHTSVAFTSAALMCLHHTELGLLGEEGDAAACATALTFATGVGALRMLADRHYFTDVVVGAGVGLVSGWLLPYLMHYASFGGGPGNAFRGTVAPRIDTTQVGLTALGQF